MFTIRWMSLTALTLSWMLPNIVHAQPMRQLPGTRPFLAGMVPQQGAPLNPRVRPAASSVGVESTDFYGKRGYPKQLGDFFEGSSGASGAAATGAAGGNNGNQGVQSSGSSGFQGNTGNQIGQNGGGTILGGLFGGGGGAGGGGGGVAGFSAPGGLTGGGFSGMVPKGFGFGGTP